MFPKANFETLSNKLYQNLTNHKRFSKPKLSRTAFTIDHYAGQVRLLPSPGPEHGGGNRGGEGEGNITHIPPLAC